MKMKVRLPWRLHRSEVEPPKTYRAWAEDYFETSVARSAVDHIFGHRPLTEKIVKRLNPELSLDDLAEDVSEIAYPTLT
jgi:hypothetical protein